MTPSITESGRSREYQVQQSLDGYLRRIHYDKKSSSRFGTALSFGHAGLVETLWEGDLIPTRMTEIDEGTEFPYAEAGRRLPATTWERRGGSKVARATRSWREKCANFHWVERATSCDAHNQQVYGTRIAVLQSLTMLRLSKKAHLDVKKLKPGDATWKDVLNTMKVISKYITPELIAEVRGRYADEADECRICGRSG